jgi:hypothetical protein
MPRDANLSAAERVLAALDADPALMPRDEAAEIEQLPIAQVTSRLGELGLAAAMPSDLRRIIVEASAASARRRLRWRRSAAALAGALAATVVLVLAYHAPPGRKVADASDVSRVQNRSASAGAPESVVLAPSAAPHLATAGDLVPRLLELAVHGDAQAQFALGLLYAIGECGAEKSYQQSVDWWRHADALGSRAAHEALGLATLFRDGQPLPPKWADLVAFIVKERASLEKLPAIVVAARLGMMVDPARLSSGWTGTFEAVVAWAAVRDGQDVDALRAFAAKYHGNFYAELALDRITRLLRFTSSFAIDTDAACRIAASYSLIDEDGKRTLHIWSLPSGRLVRTLSMSWPIAGAVVLDGTIAVLSNQEVGLFDLETGAKKQSIPMSIPKHAIRLLVASVDGKKLLLIETEAAEGLSARSPKPDGGLANSVAGVLLKLREPGPAPVRVLDVASGEIQSVMSNLLRISSGQLNCYGENAERRFFLEGRP